VLKSDNRTVLIKLCKFIKLAFNHRNSLITKLGILESKRYVQLILCFVFILVCMVYIYWVFLVSVYRVTLCLYMFVVCCITMYTY